MFFKKAHIRSFEVGLLFRDGEFERLLEPGHHRFLDLRGRLRIDICSQRDPFLQHEQLDIIVKSGVLKDRAIVLDLQDNQRGLVWVDNRFSHVLPPGQYVYWTGLRNVRTEVVDSSDVRLNRSDWKAIVSSPLADRVLQLETVARDHTGLLFYDGRFQESLDPGTYVFWKDVTNVSVVDVDRREQSLDIGGQDIMTSDKVTLRLNAMLSFRVADPLKTVSEADRPHESLYREAQLVLRAVTGSVDLDGFLSDKDQVAETIAESIRPRVERLGFELISIGIRDVILPGEMKDLMNKVTEARKAAEANLISRREETAAMRSQANTAKLLSDNPVLMKLKELEVVERVAASGQLKIVLGDSKEDGRKLTDKITGLV